MQKQLWDRSGVKGASIIQFVVRIDGSQKLMHRNITIKFQQVLKQKLLMAGRGIYSAHKRAMYVIKILIFL